MLWLWWDRRRRRSHQTEDFDRATQEPEPTLTLPDVNLSGAGVVLSGALGRLVIRDLVNGADIRTGGKPTQQTTVTATNLGDGSTIDVRSTPKALTLADVARATILAPVISALKVTGDFYGDLVLAGRNGSLLPTLGKATIGGQLFESTWTVTGAAGTITALSHLVADWTLSQQGSNPKALVLGDVTSADVTVTGRNIGSIAARSWSAGAITARVVGPVDIDGVFGATVTQTG